MIKTLEEKKHIYISERFKEKTEIPFLLELFSHQAKTRNETEMFNFILAQLFLIKDVTFESDAHGNIIATKDNGIVKADSYPTVVCHIDTVHEINANFKVELYDVNGEKMIVGVIDPPFIKKVKKWDFQERQMKEQEEIYDEAGVGGDDKCGIWACLKILDLLPKCKAVFFASEESGCIGSNNIDLNTFEHSPYIIGIDRRGNNDIIFDISGPISSSLFIEDVKTISDLYGYSSAFGMSTDVGTLSKRDVGVSCMNMSCGYYNPHTSEEFVSIPDLFKATDMAIDIIEHLSYSRYDFKRPVYERTPWVYSGYQNDLFNSLAEKVKPGIVEEICFCSDYINLDCAVHNPVVNPMGPICQCGEYTDERVYSYTCPGCLTHYLKFQKI